MDVKVPVHSKGLDFAVSIDFGYILISTLVKRVALNHSLSINVFFVNFPGVTFIQE